MGKEKKEVKYAYLDFGRKANGKRDRKKITYSSKKELNEKTRQAQLEKNKAPNSSNITLDEYWKLWSAANIYTRSPRTVEMYELTYKKFEKLKGYRLKDITTTDLQQLIADNYDHPRTCKNISLLAGRLFKSAVRDERIHKNPAEHLSLPKYKAEEKRPLTNVELEALKTVELRPMDDLFVAISYYCGLRPEETRALKKSDVDLDNNTISITKAVTMSDNAPVEKDTKNRLHRLVPIQKPLRAKLEKYLKDHPHEILFCREDGQFLTKSAYIAMTDRIFKAIQEELEKKGFKRYYPYKNDDGEIIEGTVSKFTPYIFRHNFGTMLYYNCVKTGRMSTKKAAQLMGHSEEMFIKVYTHLDDDKEDTEEFFNEDEII